MNFVSIYGRLTADPREISTKNPDKIMAVGSIAVDVETRGDEPATEFFGVVAFGRQAFLAQSGSILIWNIFFFILINVGFLFKEEPDLVKRFGEEYEEYRRHVPRWIPRLKGWSP
jgi:hypothetical protein